MVSVIHSGTVDVGTVDVSPVTAGLVLLVFAELSLWFMMRLYNGNGPIVAGF